MSCGPSEAMKAAADQVDALNAKIEKKEALFSKEVGASISSGKAFVIEDIAASFGFDLYEKRVFLFFL